MKKLLAVLLALGLLVAFCTTATAADFKMSGYYFIEGRYVSDNTLGNDRGDGDTGPSQAFYWQKLRMNPVLQVADGLKLTIRIDAHTGYWNGQRVDPTYGYYNPLHQNLRWRRTYIDAALPYGLAIRAGFTQGGTFGTWWCDGAYDEARIYLFSKMGPGTLLALTAKTTEGDFGGLADPNRDKADNDNDKYALGYLGKASGIEYGVLWYYLRYNTAVTDAGGSYTRYWHAPMAYMKGTFGPLYLEAEANYYFGKDKEYFQGGGMDIDRGGWSAYVNGKFNVGPAYVGLQLGWLQGDDPDTTDKNEAGYGGERCDQQGTAAANCDYDPCLILFNSDYADTVGTMGEPNAQTSGSLSNAWLAQVYGGFSPIEKLELFASLTWCKADEYPRIGGVDFVSKDYGYEFDITANYKIYDNLEYKVGFGYLFTGDYYKGTSDSNEVENNYLVLNRLTLNF